MGRGTGADCGGNAGTPRRAAPVAGRAPQGGEASALEQAAVIVLGRLAGSEVVDVGSLRRCIGTSMLASDADVRSIVAAKLNAAWKESPERLARPLLGAAQLALPSRRGLKRPRYQDIVTASDWQQLCQKRLGQLPSWNSIDWSCWLNGLISSRCETSARQPESASRATGQENWVTNIPRRTTILR
jgi:hypothetical protein